MKKGIWYRFGVSVKEFGERMGHIKVLGIPILRWCCSLVIWLGLIIKDSVRNCPIEEI
ncbi:MAG: hypothetical protein LBB89_06530 [Treponema sp.]|jgi:hypothetical protein|nr:hypothetical protein [Treponema sp.]